MAETVYLLVNIYDNPNKLYVEICPAEDPRLGPAISQIEGKTCWYGYPIVPIGSRQPRHPYLQCFRYLHPAAEEEGIQGYIIALDLDDVRQQISTTPGPEPC